MYVCIYIYIYLFTFSIESRLPCDVSLFDGILKRMMMVYIVVMTV